MKSYIGKKTAHYGQFINTSYTEINSFGDL